MKTITITSEVHIDTILSNFIQQHSPDDLVSAIIMLLGEQLDYELENKLTDALKKWKEDNG